jgi:hypothetical protein
MRVVLVTVGLLTVLGAAAAGERTLPEPIEQLPPPRQLGPAACAPASGMHQLKELLQEFRAEREALQTTCGSLSRDLDDGLGPVDADAARLRARVGEMLSKMDKGKAAPRALPAEVIGPAVKRPEMIKGVPAPPAPLPMPHGAPTDHGPVTPVAQPVDAVTIGQALFRAGNYESALKTLQTVDPKSQTPETKLAVQYMTAVCLRHAGKSAEAIGLFREAANSRVDEFLALCAQWELSQLRWKQGVEERLADIRKRRVALEGTAP